MWRSAHYVLLLVALVLWGVARVWYDPWRMSMFAMGVYELLTVRSPRHMMVAIETALCILAPFVEPRRDVFLAGWCIFIVFIILRVVELFSVVHVRASYMALELMQGLFILCTGHLLSLFSVNPLGNIVFLALALAMLPGGWLIYLRKMRIFRVRMWPLTLYFALVSGLVVFFVGAGDATAPALALCALAILAYAQREYSQTMWVCENTDLHGERMQVGDYLGAIVFFLERGVVPHAMVERLKRDLGKIVQDMPETPHALLVYTEQVLHHYRKPPADGECTATEAANIYRRMIVSAIVREEDETGQSLACPERIFDLHHEMTAQDIYCAIAQRPARDKPMPRFIEFLTLVCACADAWCPVVTRDAILRMVLDELLVVNKEAAARILALGASRDREDQLMLELNGCAQNENCRHFSNVAEVLGNLSIA